MNPNQAPLSENRDYPYENQTGYSDNQYPNTDQEYAKGNPVGGGYPQQGYGNPYNQNQGYQNQDYPNQGYQNQNQEYQNQGYQNQGYQNQEYQNQGYQNQGYPPNNGGYNQGPPPPQVYGQQIQVTLPAVITPAHPRYALVMQQCNAPCSACSFMGGQIVTVQPGCAAYSWACCLFCFTGIFCCWVPFVVDQCKDITVRCGRCGFVKAVVQRPCV